MTPSADPSTTAAPMAAHMTYLLPLRAHDGAIVTMLTIERDGKAVTIDAAHFRDVLHALRAENDRALTALRTTQTCDCTIDTRTPCHCTAPKSEADNTQACGCGHAA